MGETGMEISEKDQGFVEPIIQEVAMKVEPEVSREEELNKYINEWGKKVVDEDGFEYYVGEKPEELLNKLAVNGYIQHGSTLRITGSLEPHQGVNTSNESSRRTAIYMTNNPPTSLFAALTGGKADVGERNYASSMSIMDGRIINKDLIFQAEHPENMAEEGYVYILDRVNEDIEFINGEFLSYEPLKPLAVIKIKRSDFPYQVEVLPSINVQDLAIKTEIGQPALFLRKATSEDVDDLLAWDEEAKKASTATGFSPERIQQKRSELLEMINSPDTIVRIVETNASNEDNSLNKKAIGMVIAERNPRQNAVKFIDGTFMIDDPVNRGKQPLTLDEVELLIKSPNRVHILSLAISLDYRGQGLGKNAINRLFEELSVSGVEVVTFDTGIENLILQKTIKDATYVKIEDPNSGYSDNQLLGLKKL